MFRHILTSIVFFSVLFVVAQDAAAQGFKYLEVKVIDPDGKPLAEVPVTIRIDGTEFPMPTDGEGKVSINIPAGDSTELKLAVNHPGYAGLQARWGKGEKIPEKFTFPLTRGTTIGGTVQDEQGKPIEGVKVEALITAFNDYGFNTGQGELRPSIPQDLGLTDANGQWEYTAAPETDAAIQMRFNHADYASEDGFSFRGGNWEELQAKSKVVILRKGIAITGKVTDQNDAPIAGAKVSIGERFYSNRVVVTTDEDGKYVIPNHLPGTVTLTVVAEGYAPELQPVAVSRDMRPADFKLTPGKRIRLKVVNLQGEPLTGVRVTPDEWRGTRSLDRPEVVTDRQGFWEWSDAPADEVQYSFYVRGSMGLEKKLRPQDDIQIVEMHPAVVVNGNVIDKETGQPIPSFRHVEGVWWEPNYTSYVLQSMRVESGKDGKFRFQMESACHKFCVRVDADGYRPLVSREIFPDEGEIEITFELEKGKGPEGVVRTPDGSPAAGATVVLGSAEQAAQIYNGELQDFSVTKMTTGVDGQYRLPIVEGDYMLIALHESGWAGLKNPDAKAAAEIRLEPWATVKGTVLEGDKPVAQEQVIVYFESAPDNPRPFEIWNYSTETDDEGNFELKHVRSGAANLYRRFRYASVGDGWMTALSQKQPVQLLPGEVIVVKLGGEGRRVRGRLTAPEEDRDQIDWNFGVVQLNPREKADSRLNTDSAYAAPIKSDGTFEIVDVAPDEYSLKVAVYAKDYRTTGLWEPIAKLQQPCEVVDGEHSEPVDLGSFTVELVKAQD